MLHGPPELCARCAEPTLERIRRDRQRASVSAQVKALLVLIEERLCDSELRVKTLRRWARVPDTNISTRFALELGLGPEEYITQRRMKIACRLLVATDLKVWQVGTNLGYTDGHAFGRAFKNWSGGQTPTEFRKDARASSGEPETLAAPADLIDQEELRRALAGELAAERAAAVIGELAALQDQVRASYRAVDPPVPYSEPVQARGLWRFMAHLPPERRAQAPRPRPRRRCRGLGSPSPEPRNGFRRPVDPRRPRTKVSQARWSRYDRSAATSWSRSRISFFLNSSSCAPPQGRVRSGEAAGPRPPSAAAKTVWGRFRP